MKNFIYILGIIIISAFLFAGCFSSSPATSSNRYSPPDWAPAYEAGVRYYYIPDIETYYDVANGNFIYFDRGQWLYSPELPYSYRGYDLYSGYQVMLDRRVHEPWRYHQNYISSYPRYYYRSVYGNQNGSTIRGYNENARKPVYMSPSDRSRRNSTTSSSPEVNTGSAGESRTSDYGSRRAGKPVKVTPEMREPRQSGTSTESSPATTTTRRQSNSSGTRTESGNNSDNTDNKVRQRKSTSNAPPPSARRSNDETVRSSDAKVESGSGSEDKRTSRRR